MSSNLLPSEEGSFGHLVGCVSELADFFERDAAACDFGRDRLGFRSPDEGAWVLIVGVEVFLDSGAIGQRNG